MKLCGACGGGGEVTHCPRDNGGNTITETCKRCKGTGEGEFENGLTLAQVLGRERRLGRTSP